MKNKLFYGLVLFFAPLSGQATCDVKGVTCPLCQHSCRPDEIDEETNDEAEKVIIV